MPAVLALQERFNFTSHAESPPLFYIHFFILLAETVILGAFGCGAFENNPEVVAMAAKNVLKDYLHAFCNLEFAVYCTPRDENNYRVFERVLRGYCKA